MNKLKQENKFVKNINTALFFKIVFMIIFLIKLLLMDNIYLQYFLIT